VGVEPISPLGSGKHFHKVALPNASSPISCPLCRNWTYVLPRWLRN